jgi:hypothetical protein
LPDLDRPSSLRSHSIRCGELVAHLFYHSRVFAATCCDPEVGKATMDIVAQPDLERLITAPPPPHLPAGATTNDKTPFGQGLRGTDLLPCHPHQRSSM